jgi:pimeloyl-ACP methyl ester carboxylesterase
MPVIHVNDHALYYEVHGSGEPVLCMGGWGTYCHGGERNLARGLTDRYAVAIFDYRGIGESGDTPDVAANTKMHAADAIALLDHLGWKKVHLIGLVGIGACVCQEIAIARADLARSMVNMGSWAYVDDYLHDQLEMFRIMHRDSGFYAFQKLVCVLSFSPDYYNAHHSRLLGPEGGWKELNGRYDTHSRLIDACLAHDVRGRMDRIRCPTYVIHAGKDIVTSPRYTQAIEAGIPGAQGYMWDEVAHVVAGKEQKIKFCRLLFDFLDGVEASE